MVMMAFSLEETFDFEEDDQCPECGHAWTDVHQRHFSDCGYFMEPMESHQIQLVVEPVTGKNG